MMETNEININKVIDNFVSAWGIAKYREKYYCNPFNTIIAVMEKKFPVSAELQLKLIEPFFEWFSGNDDNSLKKHLLSTVR